MSSYNKCILVGNLTRDPELKTLQSGIQVTTLGLAVNNKYTTKAGEKREEVLFIDVSVWAKTAENCVKYLKKGNPVLVDGSLKMDSWETADGQKRTKIKLNGDRIVFLGGGKKECEGCLSSGLAGQCPMSSTPSIDI